MKKNKRVVGVLSVCILVIVSILTNVYGKVEAEEVVKVDNEDFYRDTSISVDVNGKLKIDRNNLGNVSMGKDDTWTLFIYMCGSDLESNSNSATKDIKEMIAASQSEDVNIVIQTGGSTRWNKPCIDANQIQRHVIRNNRLELVETRPDANMGDMKTLRSFLKWGVKMYPAEHMGVILWNHGAATLGGICMDEKNNNDTLSLTEVEKAFYDLSENMTDKFEFIGFDACVMATIEMANILVPYADYMIASEQTEPSCGWDYKPLVNTLINNPDIDGLEVAKVIVDSYIEATKKINRENITLSVMDLQKVDDMIINFNEVVKSIDEQCVSDAYINYLLQNAHISLREGAGDVNYFVVDLYDYVEKISDLIGGGEELKQSIENAVIYEKHGSKVPNAHGVTFTFPFAPCQMYQMNMLRNVVVSPYIMNLFDKIISYYEFLYDDKINQGYVDEQYQPIEGMDINNYLPSKYTLQNYCDNSWEDSSYYFENNFDFMEYEFKTLEEYNEIKEIPYYQDAQFDDIWYKIIDKFM